MQELDHFAPEINEENMQAADDYVSSILLSSPESLSEDDLKFIYVNRLQNKPVTQMSDWEATVTSLYGEMVKNQRESAEVKGLQAEIEAVRRKARAQAERQGIAAFLRTIFDDNVRKVANGQDHKPLSITLKWGDHEITVDEDIIHTAFTSIHQQQGRAYVSTVGTLLDLIGRAAQQQMQRDARPSGKDFSGHLYDISWVDIRNSLQSQIS